MELFILILIAYLIGSIPFGVILGKLAGIGDIRKVGSGNIGATNMLRAGGKKLAALTLLLDMTKGTLLCLALIIINDFFQLESRPDKNVDYQIWQAQVWHGVTYFYTFFGLVIILGHCFPVWLRFRGGKGVATMLALYAAMHFSPVNGIPAIIAFAPILCWLAIFILFRYSSLAGISAAWTGCFSMFLLRFDSGYWFFSLIIALLITFKHRENIRRLMKGEEPKVSFGKK